MGAPERFDLSRDDPAEALRRVSGLLAAGGLAVLPTETVYGLAASEASADGRAALAACKAARDRPFSLAVPSLEMLKDRLLPLSRSAQRCAARWWPGPVTLVLPDLQGARLGVRVPGHAWTRELIAALGSPLLLTSANLPGRAPPVAAGEIDPGLLGRVAAVVDGGRSALGESSTVVEPSPLCLRVLREGVVSRADLERHARPLVLVVCSGNTCRSPMAAALLTDELARVAPEQGCVPPAVRSAGLHAASGYAATDVAVDALAALGLDLSGHRTRPADGALLAEADLVLCMTRQHAAEVADRLRGGPEPFIEPAAGPAVELFDPEGRDVDDPFGSSPAAYRAVAGELRRMARLRARSILRAPPSPTRHQRSRRA